jgi:hypothetical protein
MTFAAPKTFEALLLHPFEANVSGAGGAGGEALLLSSAIPDQGR